MFCDADCAGDSGTRKSRSGRAIMCGSYLIKHGSAVHSTMALISGESEYYTLLKSSAHAFGIKAMLNDWHDEVCVATAARQEACLLVMDGEKSRHVDVRSLWLQQAVQEGRFKVLCPDM